MAERRSTVRRVLDVLTPYLVTVAVALPLCVCGALTLRAAMLSDIRWRHTSAFLLLFGAAAQRLGSPRTWSARRSRLAFPAPAITAHSIRDS